MEDYITQFEFTLDEDLNEEIAQKEEMNDSYSYFTDGMESDELPSEKHKKRKDPFFPNHF